MPVKPTGASRKKHTFDNPDFRLYTEARGRVGDLLPVKEAEGHPFGGCAEGTAQYPAAERNTPVRNGRTKSGAQSRGLRDLNV